ncbi:MAG: cytidylate kinase-like family protein [Deltaproteobacteria bacterium]|nr:cytidylate kinase-like family protein [Deltaproteobacteria bacterium]
MATYAHALKYVPGSYAKKRPGAEALSSQYVREWDERRLKWGGRSKYEEAIPPTLCFSRKIGVGALEIADLLAERTAYRVLDRELLEHIAKEAKLTEKTVALFDETYPGKLKEFIALAFGEKSFIHCDYARHLFSVVLAVAGLAPTIFVGRGTHLILPRSRVLAIRFVASRAHRVQRLMKILGATKEVVESRLDQLDREQRKFFKKAFGQEDAPAYEFDMVINLEYISKPEESVELVALAFKQKFGMEMEHVQPSLQ